MSFDTQTFILSAGEEFKLNSPINYIRLISGSSAVKITAGSHEAELELGIGLQLSETYSNIYIKSDVAQTIKVTYGKGKVDDNRLVGSVDITGGIKISGYPSGSYGTINIDTSATLIKAADTTRGKLTLQNQSLNSVYIGMDNAVTTGNGIELVGGGTIEIENEGSIYAIGSTATNDIRYWEDLTS